MTTLYVCVCVCVCLCVCVCVCVCMCVCVLCRGGTSISLEVVKRRSKKQNGGGEGMNEIIMMGWDGRWK